MQDWIINNGIAALFTALMAVLSLAVKCLWSRQKRQSSEQDAVKEGVQALLHDRIYQGYADCERKGCASVDDIKNLEYLYLPYHALGGNGTGTELFERVKKMPAAPAESR